MISYGLDSLQIDNSTTRSVRQEEKMKRKILGVLLIVLMFGVTAVSVFSEGSQEDSARGRQQFVRFGGGGPGGSWFTIVGGLSSYLSTKSDGLNVTSIATGGSVDNNRIIRQGELDTWLTHSLTAYDNWTGTGLFDGQEPYKDYRLISGVYENHHHFVTLESSKINSLADLAGKKVCMGNTGSGGAVNSENILKAIGIWDQVDPIYMTWDEAGRALMNGQIDAMGASSAPLPAVVTLDAQRDIKLLAPSDAEFKKIFKMFPAYARGVIPAGTYSTVKEDSECVSFLVYWAADKKTDPDFVKRMMAIAFNPENKKDLGNIHVHLKSLAPKFEAMEILGIPLHPGAVEFYQSQGLTVPDSIIPPEMK